MATKTKTKPRAPKAKPRASRAASDRSSRRQRRDQARAQLLRSALKLAERGPFFDITVDEIARAAGVSRSAFYTHFRDKHDLLLAAVGDVADELYRMADRWWHGEGTPANRVRQAIEGVASVYAEQASLLRVATEVSSYDEEVREVWLGISERFIEATAEHIRSEQEVGLIPESAEARSAAEALFWMSERCCYIYLGRSERNPEEVVAGLAPVWTAALYPGVNPPAQLRARGPSAAPKNPTFE